MNKEELIEKLREVHTDQEAEILIDEYADEQSRETAIEFVKYALGKVVDPTKKYYDFYNETFDEWWKSNQEGE